MEDLSMQIVEGIAQAINGEGASEMMMEDIGIDKDGAHHRPAGRPASGKAQRACGRGT